MLHLTWRSYTMKEGKDQKLGAAEFKADPRDRDTLVRRCVLRPR